MDKMNAAVVTSFGEPPHYQPFDVPGRDADGEARRRPGRRAAPACPHRCRRSALHQHRRAADDPRHRRRRAAPRRQADLLRSRRRRPRHDGGQGRRRRSPAIELPDDVDVAKVAAAMNPAMSSWVALRRRVPIQPGQSVLVLGATGNAGAWPSRWPSGSAPGEWWAPGATLTGSARWPAAGADEVVPLTADDRGHGHSAGRGCRGGRHRPRLPVGQACTAGHRWRCSPPGRTAAAR